MSSRKASIFMIVGSLLGTNSTTPCLAIPMIQSTTWSKGTLCAMAR